MKTDFDLLIVGGGMVGASLACALQDLPLRIGVVEASARDAHHPSFDMRAIALSKGTQRILDTMGVWPRLTAEGATAIRRIHVSDRGHFGSAQLTAADEGTDALGYVAEATAMGRAFEAALAEVGNATLLRPAHVKSLTIAADHARVLLHTSEGEQAVTTRLLVAADGGRSAIRELLGGRRVRLGYGQTAIIAYVATDRPHDHTAYERFTDTGPLALLPCRAAPDSAEAHYGDRRWSLVWTARDAEVEEILALGDDAFLARLQTRLGHRAGTVIHAGPRVAYPLVLNYLRDFARPRVVFIGNAAHAIHPVGGQGYNLGLRDVAALAEVIAEAVANGGDLGDAQFTAAYIKWRQPDYARVLALTDTMARAFASPITPLIVSRNLGLMGLDLLPPVKHLFARQFMGLTGKQPRLARGVKLSA